VTSTSDPFRYDDAAYVMGALDDADRLAFEAHLETCPECQARVAEARATTGLLAGITAADLDEPAPMPDTLLPGLLRSARRDRMRTRWLTSGLGSLAAASVAALVVVLWPGGSTTSPGEAMNAVRPSPVAATAKLVAKGWGTEIDLECRYSDSVQRYAPYSLTVIDDQGIEHPAGSWLLAPGNETEFTGGTSVRREDIAKVQITLQDGTPILELRA
jgi:predicted anti-sigma-YlaC factor YlaD